MSKRKRMRIRRRLILLAALLSLVSLLAAAVLVSKALHIIDSTNRMLLPLLSLSFGLAGALAKTAGWLGGW